MSDSPDVSLTRERSKEESTDGLRVEEDMSEDVDGLVGVLNGTRVWFESMCTGEGGVGLTGDDDGNGG